MKRRILLGAALLVFVGKAMASSARFEPATGKTLLILGQNLEDIESVIGTTHIIPGGLMAYTSVAQGEGLDAAFNQGDGTQFAQTLVDRYPQSALQIGLWMVDECAPIAQGQMDQEIDRLGNWIQKTHRPVFLRIGYEFDGPQNHYPPNDYVEAFRHIVDRFRKLGIKNVATVWHSYAGPVHQPLADWYPGDDYVDWVGLSYFDQPQSYKQAVVDWAKQHGKPVIIAESSPWRVQTKYPNAWNLWFAPLFKFIAANHIKALSYISCDWDSMQQFQNEHWGYTRLDANPAILLHWLQETAQDRYLKASPELFKQLGYKND